MENNINILFVLRGSSSRLHPTTRPVEIFNLFTGFLSVKPYVKEHIALCTAVRVGGGEEMGEGGL